MSLPLSMVKNSDLLNLFISQRKDLSLEETKKFNQLFDLMIKNPLLDNQRFDQDYDENYIYT